MKYALLDPQTRQFRFVQKCHCPPRNGRKVDVTATKQDSGMNHNSVEPVGRMRQIGSWLFESRRTKPDYHVKITEELKKRSPLTIIRQ
jgi:hypothetical protein